MTTDIAITRASASEPEAQALIKRHLAQMAAQSPAESCHALDGSGLDAADVAFFLLRRDGRAIAMGALKSLRDGGCELKSMHTLAEARGSGAGRQMLEFLLDRARSDGASAVYLETGSTEDFTPAKRLYESYGFVECPPFGDYSKDPWSLFMRLDLRAAA
ncbi:MULTISPECIES: GNAT family N-acetyltransferase [unclassified Phaeobacter]|uniref:GNAT family N-acetyltransferase n=1 Tax=unclassified Phaeobacter TaxID=2621772 RepID=UPI003A854102